MRTRKPAWWQLYALVPSLIVAVIGEQLHPLFGLQGEGVDVLIITLGFGAMIAWVNWNRGALEQEELRQAKDILPRITVYEPVTRGETVETEQTAAAGSTAASSERDELLEHVLEKEQSRWSRN